MKYLIGIGGLALLGAIIFMVFFEEADVNRQYSNESELVAKEPVREDGDFTVVTSFYPLTFAVERIGGNLVSVENIGAGRDPHDFEPSTQDVLSLQGADLVVLQGADFEPWGDGVVEQLQDQNVPVLIATAQLSLLEGGHDEHGDEHEEDQNEDEHEEDEHGDEHEEDDKHGAYDPHTWLDPVIMSETVARIADALVSLDPENASTYRENADALRAELAELDMEYAETLAQCQLSEVITSHDSFGYVGARYGFEIHTIAGLSTQDSPSAVILAELREEAEEGVGAILLEESSVTAYGETLSRETGLQTLNINPIAFLIPEGEDYLTLSRRNLEAFATALVCNE